MGGGAGVCGQYVAVSPHHSCLLTLFPCSGVASPWAAVLQGKICSAWCSPGCSSFRAVQLLHELQGSLCHGAWGTSTLRSSLTLVLTCLLSVLFLLLCLYDVFCPFLNTFLLIDSALLCGGDVAELAGAVSSLGQPQLLLAEAESLT